MPGGEEAHAPRPLEGRPIGPAGRVRAAPGSFGGRFAAPARTVRPPDAVADGQRTEELLGSDEELVAGRRPVEEAFVARRPALRLLVVPQRRQALERIVLHATSLRIPIVEVEGGTLTSVAGFDGHQGVALVVRPRVWAGIADVLARAVERREPPFVLVLDSLEDPQNVGTLLRSAEAVGVHGVLFPTHRQAPLSPAAIKASAGATEHLLLVPVDDLPGALADLHVHGLRVVGADEEAPLTAREADLRGPIALVVGSEGQGIGPAVRRRVDLSVRIRMRGAIGSLNASVAGSIVLFEILEQRGGVPATGPEAEAATDTGDAATEGDSATVDIRMVAGPGPAAPAQVASTADVPIAVAAEPGALAGEPAPALGAALAAEPPAARRSTRARKPAAGAPADVPPARPRARRSPATSASLAAPAVAVDPDELLPGGPSGSTGPVDPA
jgi:23S rRNA (guanosine2251-2'-O)-methyltransferase